LETAKRKFAKGLIFGPWPGLVKFEKALARPRSWQIFTNKKVRFALVPQDEFFDFSKIKALARPRAGLGLALRSAPFGQPYLENIYFNLKTCLKLLEMKNNCK
jgi:hypothetical protein